MPQSRPSLSISPELPVVCGQLVRRAAGHLAVASYLPLSIAAAAVTSLKVEPGGSVSLDRPVEQRLGRVGLEPVVVALDRW